MSISSRILYQRLPLALMAVRSLASTETPLPRSAIFPESRREDRAWQRAVMLRLIGAGLVVQLGENQRSTTYAAASPEARERLASLAREELASLMARPLREDEDGTPALPSTPPSEPIMAEQESASDGEHDDVASLLAARLSLMTDALVALREAHERSADKIAALEAALLGPVADAINAARSEHAVAPERDDEKLAELIKEALEPALETLGQVVREALERQVRQTEKALDSLGRDFTKGTSRILEFFSTSMKEVIRERSSGTVRRGRSPDASTLPLVLVASELEKESGT